MVLTGRFVVVAAVTASLVVVRPDWSTLLVWLLAITALWVVDVARAPRPRELKVARSGATSLRALESAELRLTVTNTSNRHFVGMIRDAWPPSLRMQPSRHTISIDAGDRRALKATVTSTRRGARHPDRVTVRSLGPWQLGGRQQSRQMPWRIDVLPPFESRRHLPAKLAELRDLEGRSVVLQRGQGTEFDSLREYVNGDDVRSIDWRATARAADVMV
ncbi:MAG TPA: DUF58 domain-containing protein, partial [Actinomycetes bacterium]|nr:DUF58 domain-containing protein [Actinomycetes bacterium]